jgi:hypothetical protein
LHRLQNRCKRQLQTGANAVFSTSDLAWFPRRNICLAHVPRTVVTQDYVRWRCINKRRLSTAHVRSLSPELRITQDPQATTYELLAEPPAIDDEPATCVAFVKARQMHHAAPTAADGKGRRAKNKMGLYPTLGSTARRILCNSSRIILP